MEHLYILATILLTVYGQIIIKWRIVSYGALPIDLAQKIEFFMRVLLDPFILSGLVAAFFASLSWMAAMTKFDISYAYPFTSLSFVLVFIAGIYIFKEPVSLMQISGFLFVLIGLFLGSRG